MKVRLIDECRAAFEQWVATWPENGHFNMIRQHPDGRFEYDKTRDAWRGWQAAWEFQQETIYALRSAWDAECPT